MTSRFDTDSALAFVLEELERREPIFHRSEFGTSRVDFSAMTAEDFWEVGASGRTYSRDQVLAILEQATPIRSGARRPSRLLTFTAAAWQTMSTC